MHPPNKPSGNNVVIDYSGKYLTLKERIAMADAKEINLSEMLSENEFAVEPGLDTYVVSPIDGLLVYRKDADQLIDAYEEAKEKSDELYRWMRELREHLSKLASEGDKTRRVKGQRRQAKLTMPSETWNQSILKEVWNSYPDRRDDLLRVATLGVNKRNFKKAIGTNGPDDYNNFVKMVASAENPPSGLPTVAIEE